MNDRDERSAANTAAALRMAQHLLGIFSAQRWNGQQIAVMEQFGDRIRDLCDHFAHLLRVPNTEEGVRRRVQDLWNRVQDASGIRQTSLFPPSLDPKLVVLRHLFDLARRGANRESDKTWTDAIGFYEKHTRDALPADKPHTISDPTVDSCTLWRMLPATGAVVSDNIPNDGFTLYRNTGSMPERRGLNCAEVVLRLVTENRHSTVEATEHAFDEDYYRADLSTAVSLLLLQPNIFQTRKLYLFSGVSRNLEGAMQYLLVAKLTEGGLLSCQIRHPNPGESYISVRLAK